MFHIVISSCWWNVSKQARSFFPNFCQFQGKSALQVSQIGAAPSYIKTGFQFFFLAQTVHSEHIFTAAAKHKAITTFEWL